MELENEKSECVNENENKENKNVDECHEFILQQKPANTKVKTYSDMKAWKRFCLQENEKRELSDIPEEELNLLLCKFFQSLTKLDGIEYVRAWQFDVLSTKSSTLLERKRFKCKYY